jgi:hypothetical protein
MTQKQKGSLQIVVWAVLIVAGIISKRMYDHPEWMMLFHGPAAVFLVMGMKNMAVEFRNKYNVESQKYLASLNSSGSELNR